MDVRLGSTIISPEQLDREVKVLLSKLRLANDIGEDATSLFFSARDLLEAYWEETERTHRTRFQNDDLLARFLDEPSIWVLAGIPGSGKTTLAAATARRGRVCLSIDAIREELGLAFGRPDWVRVAYDELFRRLRATSEPRVLLDSSGVYTLLRRRAISWARHRNVPARLIIVATPPRTAFARGRTYGQPDGAAFSLWLLYSLCRQIPEFSREGFTSLHWLDLEGQGRLIQACTAA